tara:strand:- start:488 stop:1021 length:534 start_codon:yes stop_codon:yes gene_type:complete
MFLGLQLLFLLLISPIIIGVFFYGLKRKTKSIGKIILAVYTIGFSIIVIMSIVGTLAQKKVLDKSDFYGEYIVDKNYFSGKQADWQYNNFRFEIKKNDSIYLYITDGKIINETYKGKISTVMPYESARLVIEIKKTNHHILTTNPTIYRQAWGFFMVFNSPKFHNMYFRKGKWKKIE